MDSCKVAGFVSKDMFNNIVQIIVRDPVRGHVIRSRS
jgi:hypothetical protein